MEGKECLPEIAREFGIPVRDNGTWHAMEAEYLVQEYFGNFRCSGGGLSGDKVGLLA